ncbi:MAG: transcription elongation factor GreA [Candidatus Levybacteria bacterium]|nr:transcription elongation factor GreA [Candidatus Levybacteria bacterium]
MDKKIAFTKEGFAALQKEYLDLLNSRRPAVEDLKKAREMGDLSENGYYKSAKSKLSSIDYNLRRLNYLIKSAVVVERQKEYVDVGSQVILVSNGKKIEYQIVGSYESNPQEGKISNVSPLGKELISKKIGGEATVTTPSGKVSYKIVKIE